MVGWLVGWLVSLWGRGSLTRYFTGFAHSHSLFAASAWLAGFWAGWLLPLLLGWLAVVLVGFCGFAVGLASCCCGWWLAWRLFRNLSCWLKSRPAASVVGCGAPVGGRGWLSGCVGAFALLAGLWLVVWSLGCRLVVGGLLCCAGVGRSVGVVVLLPSPPRASRADPGGEGAGSEAGDDKQAQRRQGLGEV